MGNKDYHINLIINESFLKQAGETIRIPSNSNNISSFD